MSLKPGEFRIEHRRNSLAGFDWVGVRGQPDGSERVAFGCRSFCQAKRHARGRRPHRGRIVSVPDVDADGRPVGES